MKVGDVYECVRSGWTARQGEKVVLTQVEEHYALYTLLADDANEAPVSGVWYFSNYPHDFELVNTPSVWTQLENEEFLIFDNIESFIRQLATATYDDIMELYQVSFSSETVHFVYVLHSGQHIADSCTSESYDAWKASLT